MWVIWVVDFPIDDNVIGIAACSGADSGEHAVAVVHSFEGILVLGILFVESVYLV